MTATPETQTETQTPQTEIDQELEQLANVADIEDEATAQEFTPDPNANQERPTGREPVEYISGVGVLIADLLPVVFDFLAERRGPHWVVEKKSCDRLGQRWGLVLEKHFPNLRGAFDNDDSAEVVAITDTVATLYPRISQDKRLAKQRQEKVVNGQEPG